jgi:adenylate cyclase
MFRLKKTILRHYRASDFVTKHKAIAFYHFNTWLFAGLIAGLACYVIWLPVRLPIAGPPMLAGMAVALVSLALMYSGRFQLASLWFSFVSALVLLLAQGAKLYGDYTTAYSSFVFLFTLPVLVAGLFNSQGVIVLLGAIMALGNTLFYVLMSQGANHTNDVMLTVGFISSILIICLTTVLVLLVRRIMDRALENLILLNASMSRFIPFQFLTLLKKESVTDLALGDSAALPMTVLFCDLRGFTALTEKLGNEKTFLILNEYLGLIGPLVRKHRGFVDKYIGDAVMALFPTADHALGAAEEMVSALGEFNRGRTLQFRFGIGISSGMVTIGAIGEKERVENTVISDVVNIASRLQELTKLFGVPVLVSESTVEQSSLRHRMKKVDTIQVRGKVHRVGVYSFGDELPRRPAESHG